ncbi:MAG: hypothetical protein Q9160_003981 [Pyrenula sp. 1 TL-2023]
MIIRGRSALPAAKIRHAATRIPLAAVTSYGRTAAYRRSNYKTSTPNPLVPSWQTIRTSAFTSPSILFQAPLFLRLFHSGHLQHQQESQKSDPRDGAPESSKGTSESEQQASGSQAGQSTEDKEHKREGSSDSSSKSKDGSKKQEAPPPPPHGSKSAWQVFTDTLQSEFRASKEWNESTKALASSAHQFTESDSVKRARAAYSAASGAATSRTSEAIKSTGKVIGSGAAWTWQTPVVKGLRGGVNATGRGIERATRPVRDTKAFQSIKETVDDGSSSRYGGWVEKEERRKQKELRELKQGRVAGEWVEQMEEDPNAGTNVTVHKDAAWKESWNDFRDSSKLMQSLFTLRSTYNDSENPLISTARSITDRVAGFFAENETAMVIKKFREMDPNFQTESFLREVREYMLPEVLDAYVKGDVETLKLWLSAAQFQVYSALAQQYTTAGLKSDGRILDIRNVDILNARILEPGEIPVFIITCRTQEVHVYRNAKSNELAAGMEDKVQLVTYAIGMTRLPEDVNNPETRGWRMIELQKAARDYF